jgi:hypothetical protein
MSERAVVIIGLPESGKTTFLAALWHVATARDIPTKLQLSKLIAGEATHLHAISARWRDATCQDRTAVGGMKIVSMSLIDHGGREVEVTFPDVPGEEYRRMWEERDCGEEIAKIMRTGEVMLFIHADTIMAPRWIAGEAATNAAAGLTPDANKIESWEPALAPTQVQLVDLLQQLREPPLDVGPRRLALMLSAWDLAAGERLDPDAYLAQKMPFLYQYLRRNLDKWAWRIFGISAQGGEYDPVDPHADRSRDATELRKRDSASTRVDVVSGDEHSHDLTAPLYWLME